MLKKYDWSNVRKQSCDFRNFFVFITIFLKFRNVNTFSSRSVGMIIRQNVNTVRTMNIQLTDNSCANDIFVYTGY